MHNPTALIQYITNQNVSQCILAIVFVTLLLRLERGKYIIMYFNEYLYNTQDCDNNIHSKATDQHVMDT